MIGLENEPELLLSMAIPGEPQGKGRPRFTKNGGAYTPPKTRNYEKLITLEAQEIMSRDEPITDAVEVEIVAVYKIPMSASKVTREAMQQGDLLPTKRPDIDNIAKAILDGMNGVVYQDDAQVTRLTIRKEYGYEPKVIVNVYV